MVERSTSSSFPSSSEYIPSAGGELPPETTFDVKEKVVYGIWRSRWIVALLLAIGGAAGLIAAAASPNTYTSVARLRLRAGKAETLSLEEFLGVAGDRPTAMSTVDEVFLLQDPEIYAKVVAEMKDGPQSILVPPDPTLYDTTDTPLHIALLHRIQKGLFDTFFQAHCTDRTCAECLQTAAMVLQSRTTLFPEKSSNVISVEHLSFSPELARLTADSIVAAAVDRHKDEFKVSKYVGMTENTITKSYESLEHAKTDYEQHRQVCGFIDIRVQKENLLAQKGFIEQSLANNQAVLVGEVAQLGALKAQLEKTPETVAKLTPAQPGLNPDWQLWENRLQNFRLLRDNLYTQMSKSKDIIESEARSLDPRIKEAEEMVKELEKVKIIESIPAQSTQVPNDYHFELQKLVMASEAAVSRLTALIDANKTSLVDTNKDLKLLLTCEPKHDRWDLDIKEKEGAYQKLSGKNAELEAMAALDLQPEANLHVFQQPTLPFDKDGPKRSKFVGMGLAGGLAIGMGIALLVQFLDRRLRYPVTVERELRLPLIGVVPEVPALHGLLRRQRVA